MPFCSNSVPRNISPAAVVETGKKWLNTGHMVYTETYKHMPMYCFDINVEESRERRRKIKWYAVANQ